MKLRKAIEKAKKERSRNRGTITLSSKVADTDYDESLPPDYSESRRVDLDLDVVGNNRCVCLFPEQPANGAYKILRTQIQQRIQEKGHNTVMVTSVLPGEGKTLTSINLALTFAKEISRTVLLVDCDLRAQRIHEYLGYKSDLGLISYLVDSTPIRDLIVWPGVEKLSIISGGKKIHDSTELIGSPKMKSLIKEMRSRYSGRFIIFDTPPVLTGADAIAFAPLVDSIILVVEEGRTSMDDIKKALDLLPKEKFLGFVMNRDTSPIKEYGTY